jgi:hypothetical protein
MRLDHCNWKEELLCLVRDTFKLSSVVLEVLWKNL